MKFCLGILRLGFNRWNSCQGVTVPGGAPTPKPARVAAAKLAAAGSRIAYGGGVGLFGASVGMLFRLQFHDAGFGLFAFRLR